MCSNSFDGCCFWKFLSIRKANVNLAEPCCGWTALQCAVVGRNMLMIELLMSKGAKHDVKDKRGQSPLQEAAIHGHKEIVSCLMDHGADINAEDLGKTLIASVCHLEIVEYLVNKGADVN